MKHFYGWQRVWHWLAEWVKAIAVDVSLNSYTFLISRVQFSASNKIKPSFLKNIQDLNVSVTQSNKFQNQTWFKAWTNLDTTSYYEYCDHVKSQLPWMRSFSWNLLMNTRTLIVTFTDYFPSFICIADYSIGPIFKNLCQKPNWIWVNHGLFANNFSNSVEIET